MAIRDQISLSTRRGLLLCGYVREWCFYVGIQCKKCARYDHRMHYLSYVARSNYKNTALFFSTFMLYLVCFIAFIRVLERWLAKQPLRRGKTDRCRNMWSCWGQGCRITELRPYGDPFFLR